LQKVRQSGREFEQNGCIELYLGVVSHAPASWLKSDDPPEMGAATQNALPTIQISEILSSLLPFLDLAFVPRLRLNLVALLILSLFSCRHQRSWHNTTRHLLRLW